MSISTPDVRAPQAHPAESVAAPAADAGTGALYRRLLRRETRSPRSTAAILVAAALILVFAWLGTEVVLALLGLGALLATPLDMFTSAVNLVSLPVEYVAPAGIVVAVIGLILVILALAPGRRAKHTLLSERAATVIDNEAIASALARRAALVADVDPDHTSVSVSHRLATVYLTPTSGRPVDRDAVTAEVSDRLESYGLIPRLRARVQIAQNGKVGA